MRVYLAAVPRLALAIRLLAYVLAATGILLIVVSQANGERANASGFVPGVALGFLAISSGVLSSIAAERLREARYARVALVIGLMAWTSASTFLVVWALPPGSLRVVPLGAVLGVAILAGFIGTLYLGTVVPIFWALGWIADKIPALRRSKVGSEIRRQTGGRL
jgi:hypothetical protein